MTEGVATADRQLESAGRCLAAALAERNLGTMAALLRAAAKYLDGASGQAEPLAVSAVPR